MTYRDIYQAYIIVRALIVMLKVIKNDATLSMVRFDYFLCNVFRWLLVLFVIILARYILLELIQYCIY